MGAASLILRIMVATILVITVGTIGVFGFTVLEPFFTAFGEPPAALNWGSLGLTTVTFASAGFIGLFVVIILWLVYSPIREDRRQQFRR